MLNKRKIVLEANPKTKEIYNTMVGIISFVVIAINLFSFIVLNKHLVSILSIIISLIYILFMFNYGNQKIEINDSIITKIYLFNIKKRIGTLSEITSFSNNRLHIVVLSNNKKLFTFFKNGSEDNYLFHTFLKDNYNNSVYICNNIYMPYITICYGLLMIALLTFKIQYLFIFALYILVMLILAINERLKLFQVIDDNLIIDRTLFYYKKINIIDLTGIIDKRKYYKLRSTIREITGYINNKKVFKTSLFPEEVECFKQIIKKNNIKYSKKN